MKAVAVGNAVNPFPDRQFAKFVLARDFVCATHLFGKVTALLQF